VVSSMSADDLQALTSAAQTTEIVDRIVADLRSHADAWENTTLERYLEAIASCLRVQQQLYANRGQAYPATPTWTQFAEALVAASGYE